MRDVDEVAEWQIPGVHDIPVNSLESRIDEVPCDLGLVTICAAGTRALRAAEILAAHGIASDVLQGGMNAWASTFDSVTGQFGGATVMQLRRRGKDVSLTSSAQVPTVSSSTPPS